MTTLDVKTSKIASNFVPHENNVSYGEIFQSVEVRMAFINRRGHEIFYPVRCRDFLCDAILSKHTGKPVNVWGFKYSYEKTKFHPGWVSLHFPDAATFKNFKQNWKLGKMYIINDNTILASVGSQWFTDPWKISWLTMKMKFACFIRYGSFSSPESRYYREVKGKEKMLDKLAKGDTWLWENESEMTSGYHDRLGVIYNLKLLEKLYEQKTEVSKVCK